MWVWVVWEVMEEDGRGDGVGEGLGGCGVLVNVGED